MPDGFRIATAWVQVSPDLDGFREELKEKLDEAVAGMTARARVDLDTSELDAKADEARAKVDELDSVRAEPTVHLNDEDLAAKADEAHARLDELDNRSARPDVGLESGDLEAQIEETRARLDELDSRHADPRVTLDTAEFDAELAATEGRLTALGGESVGVRVYARDSRGRFTSASPAEEEGGGGGGRTFRRDSRGRFLGAAEEEAEPDAPGGSRFRTLFNTVLQRLRGAGDQGTTYLGNAGSSIGEFLGEHKLAASVVGGVTALLPGIAGAGMGLGLLGGAGVLGLGGIGEAVSAAHQSALNIGLTPQQLAATRFSNQVGVQQAQDQLGQAHMQAAQDAITSAQSIESAQMNLASVERNAAEQQVQALQSVKQAQQGVEEANYGLSEAQYNLTQAWEAAKEQIAQLNDQLNDSKLSVKQAQLAIQQAEYQQRLINQNAYSTQLDREQAALAVAQAQQHLTDAQDQQTAAQYKANLVNKQGVEGSQLVIQAKQGVVQAQYGQIDAQAQYAAAQRQLTLTELNNASEIKMAHMQLSAAQEQAGFQSRMDARNIAIAQRNVTNTIKEQQLQWAATMSTENQAALVFQKDMSRLSPAARAVVQQILSMKSAFHGMAVVAQTAIAPGISLLLTGLSKSMPKLTSGIGQVGNVISGVFSSVGKSLQSASGAKVLDGLIANGVQFAKIVVPALAGFIGALAKVGSQKGAVDGIANLIGGLAGGLTNVVKAISPFTGAFSTIGTVLGKALGPVGTLLGGVVGQLAQTLAPLLSALLPIFQQLVGQLGGALTQALAAAAPGLAAIMGTIVQLLPAVTPLISIFGVGLAGALKVVSGILLALNAFLSANMSWLRPLATIILGVVAALKIWSVVQAALNLILDTNPVVLITLAIAALVGGVIYAYKHFAWFRDAVNATFSGIETAALWLWHNVFDPFWHFLVDSAVWVYHNAILPIWNGFKDAFNGIESAAMWLWHNVLDPMWQGLESGVSTFVSAFGTVWNTLENVFKTPVNFLIEWVYTKGIENLWNEVVNAIGMGNLKLPDIKGLATGGVLPGYAPGHDTIPAMLSPGEGVLVPEAVRALGPGTVDALNATFGGGRVSSAGHYSGGGIIGSLWHGVTSAFGKGLDIAKIGAAVMTGNTTALSNALTKLVGTNAVGDLGKMMLGLPTSMIHNLVKAVTSMFSGGGSSGGGGGSIGGTIPSGQHLAIIDAALAAAGVPPPGTKGQWEAGLNTLINRESGWNPRAINLTDINAMHGDPSRGLAQTIMATFMSHHVPGTSMDIYDPVANVAAAIRYIVGRYGNITRVQQANASLPPMGYDSGGWLMPSGLPVNGLRKPEAVLTPDESQAFVQIVRHLTSQPSAALGPKAEINFYGTQYPNAEQMAAIHRSMGLALSGG